MRYWGEWVLERARAELAEFYPADEGGKTPVAYLWARTVTCTNLACRAEVPMVRSWWLAKKTGKQIVLKPVARQGEKKLSFEVVKLGKNEIWPEDGTIERGNAVCQFCSTTIPVESVRVSAKDKSWGQRILAVVLTGSEASGKSYRAATEADETIFEKATAKLKSLEERHEGALSLVPDEPLPPVGTLGFRVNLYGLDTWGKLFNPRQALALVTFAKWVRQAHAEMLRTGLEEEEARGVATYLGILVSRLSDYNNTICTWRPQHDQEKVNHAFTRQALPMAWDYAEMCPFTKGAGDWLSSIEQVTRTVIHAGQVSCESARVLRGSATKLPIEDDSLDAILTDPPYYDAVPYADLSDFFYVWLKRTVGHLYPSEFRTPLTPKAQEAVQNPVRHGGDNLKAKAFYEDMMTQAFREMNRVLKPSGEATIVFAHKSTDAWETLIGALIKAGFRVEASWPLNTEMATRLRAQSSAALASSTFLNCTKRTSGSVGYFNEVRREMQESIRPQLKAFWASGIRGADFFMSAIGPGLESYSRFDEVRRASGEPVGVGEFLDEVRKIVLEFALSQVMKEARAQDAIDEATQFGLLSLWAYGYELPSDEARKLAQSMSVELSLLADAGLVEVKGEKARVLKAAERLKKRPRLGLPLAGAAGVSVGVPMVDAMHRATLLLKEGRQAIADYLGAVRYLEAETFWRTTQAFAEVLHDEDEGRALDELLTLRDNLPKPTEAAQAGLFA